MYSEMISEDIEELLTEIANEPPDCSPHIKLPEHTKANLNAAEKEPSKPQRQFRIMESDQQAFSSQSQEIICKQELEIEKLRREEEELQENLRVTRSRSHRQSVSRDAKKIRALLERSDYLDKQFERERLTQAELEREIQRVQKKMEELRKGDDSASHSQKSPTRHSQEEACRILENKLDQTLVRFNKQLAKNRQLREEVDTLYLEHVRFQKLHRKLEKFLARIADKLPDYSRRIELPEHKKATLNEEEESSEDADSEVITREALKCQSQLLIEENNPSETVCSSSSA